MLRCLLMAPSHTDILIQPSASLFSRKPLRGGADPVSASTKQKCTTSCTLLFDKMMQISPTTSSVDISFKYTVDTHTHTQTQTCTSTHMNIIHNWDLFDIASTALTLKVMCYDCRCSLQIPSQTRLSKAAEAWNRGSPVCQSLSELIQVGGLSVDRRHTQH